MNSQQVKVGIVGLGIGALHVESLKSVPQAKLIAVADLDPARGEKFAAETGARPYLNWQAMLDGEPELEAVILATPAVVRMDPIRAICERKLGLFCEKPPAVNLAEGLRISEVISNAGIINSVGFMYRWAPLAVRMRELIAGRPRLFARGLVAWPVLDWVRTGSAPKSLYSKAACGGPLIEQAIHYQDVLRFITGDEPTQVQAMSELGVMFDQNGRDCEETTAYVLRHQSGMLSNHIHNWSYSGTLMQIQIVGPDYDLLWYMNHHAMKLVGNIDGQAIDETCESEYYRWELEGFVKAVGAGDQSIIRSSYADACRSLAVCEAATTAVSTGDRITIQ